MEEIGRQQMLSAKIKAKLRDAKTRSITMNRDLSSNKFQTPEKKKISAENYLKFDKF